jgi:hypothetical protein
MIVFNLAFTGHGHGQLNECAHQLPVNFLGPLCRRRTGCVKEQLPVDRTIRRHRAESQEIRKERHGIGVQIQSITVANLSVAVTISCVGKLEWYESATRRSKPLPAFSKHLICKGLSDERGQKLIKNDPLIVPA